MNYELVELNEKTVVGLTKRTRNDDPGMGATIGGLWQRFYSEGTYGLIPNKKNECSIGLYSNYESDAQGEYDVTVGCEVLGFEDLPVETTIHKISAGKYAKFIVKGHMQKAVGEFWMNLWAMDLNRTFSYDFEEYQSGGDMENCEIHIYISVK